MYIDSIKWVHPATTLLSGPSNSGKTSLLTKILKNHDNLFEGTKIQTILFYNHWQPIYTDWEAAGLVAYSYQGIPNIEEFKSLCTFYTLQNGVSVIFDDLGSEILKNLDFFEQIFVVLSHHMKISVFLVLHNLFEKGLQKISLNSNRIILTNNTRDVSQISYFARQSFPGTKNFLPAVYKYICGLQPYGYLILDFCQNRNKYLKVTTNWFEDKSCIMTFCENNMKCKTEEAKSFLCYHLVPSSIYNLLSRNNIPVHQNTNVISNNAIYTPPSITNQYSQPNFSNDTHAITPKMSIDKSDDNDYVDVGVQSQQKDDNQSYQTDNLGVDEIIQTENNGLSQYTQDDYDTEPWQVYQSDDQSDTLEL